jgi:hypothetical protein
MIVRPNRIIGLISFQYFVNPIESINCQANTRNHAGESQDMHSDPETVKSIRSHFDGKNKTC